MQLPDDLACASDNAGTSEPMRTSDPVPSTLVLGIGNTLLSDEGIGIHVVHRLADDAPDLQATLMDGGTLSFTLAGPIEDCQRLIVVDAAELKAPPGTLRVFLDDAMDRHVAAGGKRSVHEVGLADLLAVAALAGRLPPQRALVGIQPECVDWGTCPTSAVANALPSACAAIEQLVEVWPT
jgi:hydrogenase maturation protease